MNQEEKDIINKIVKGLKNQPELPYKEGAWEKFRDERLITMSRPGMARIKYIKWSAVAALLLMSGVFLYKYYDNSSSDEISLSVINQSSVEVITPSHEAESDNIIKKELDQTLDVEEGDRQQITAKNIVEFQAIELRNRQELLITDIDVVTRTEDDYKPKIASLDINALKLKEARVNLTHEVEYTMPVTEMNRYEFLGQQSFGKAKVYSNTDFQPKKQVSHKFTNNLNLGLFVSSMSTDRKMNFGGGLLMSYKLSPKLSIRTGLSFNQYQVEQMKDPAISQEYSTVPSETKSGNWSDVQNSPTMGSVGGGSFAIISGEVMIPNINAVSAQVQSFDIPLEMKYQFGQGFYSTGGISYTKVINQKRYAHYDEIDNIYMPGRQEQRKVTKTVESVDNRLSKSKFGGFVGLSVGKKVPLNKKALSLSVEPYVKFPVGQFSKSDLNYTNGGIRIITNFK